MIHSVVAGRGKAEKPRFGIGEWYGRRLESLTAEDRVRLNEARKGGVPKRPDCPFRVPRVDGSPQKCTKPGGVCSLKLYEKGPDVAGIPSGIPVNDDGGSLRVMCPFRFHEEGHVFSEVGKLLLNSDDTEVIVEVGFLMPEPRTEQLSSEAVEEDTTDKEDVGRIDSVLVRRDLSDWCAVEMQAVYFSGSEMGAEFELAARYAGAGAPFPAKKRHPDYRSSGPKRLMPQLQIKVPTLRRWGKKMAVVVDEAFFSALGRMDHVRHSSNADIVWIVVHLEEGDGPIAKLKLKSPARYTTLERAVEGLTAGHPVTLPEFENRIKAKIEAKERDRQKQAKKIAAK